MVTNSLHLFFIIKWFFFLCLWLITFLGTVAWAGNLCSFRMYRTSGLICLPLYVTWSYSAKVFNILFLKLLFCTFGVFSIMWHGVFSSWVWSIWCSACLLFLDKYLLSWIWEFSIIYNTYSCFCATEMSELGDINYIVSGNALPSVSEKESSISKDILYL